MEAPRASMEVRGTSMNDTDAHERARGTSTELREPFRGGPWRPMEAHGGPWKPMGLHGNVHGVTKKC